MNFSFFGFYQAVNANMLDVMFVIKINKNKIHSLQFQLGRVYTETASFTAYHIQPNSCTVPLGFSDFLGKFVVKYVSTYTGDTLKKRSAKDVTNDANVMFLCAHFFFFPIFFIKAYVVGTHLKCINKSMQF